jgi:hypothetical protein
MMRRLADVDVRMLVAALVAGAVGVFALAAMFGIFNPQDTSQPEGAVIAGALRVAHGEPLFLDIRKGPYVTAMYGPVLYVALGAAAKLLGAGVAGAYLLGRILSILAALGSALIVARLARHAGADDFAARIAGGLFLASPIILPVAYSSRSDMPALALSLLGMLLYVLNVDSGRRYLAVLPLVAAAFTKQTALAATLAIALHLVSEKRLGRAILFMAAVGAPCLLIMAGLDRATGGLAMLNLVEVPGASPLSLISRPLGALAMFLGLAALPLILAAPALLSGAEGRLRLPACYLLASLAVSLAASSKLGSDTYYFMEPLAASLILAGVGLTRLLGREAAPLKQAPAALLAGLFLIGIASSVGMTGRMAEFRYRSNDEAVRIAAHAPGDVLVEDENVALKCGKPLTMMDPFAFAYLEKRGRWDPGPLNRRILAREFGAILLRSPVEHPSHYQGENYWAPTTLEAMDRAYRMEQKVDGLFVYRPRAELAARAAGESS